MANKKKVNPKKPSTKVTNGKVTRKMLLKEMARRSGADSETTMAVFTSMIDVIVENVRDGSTVSITGLGNFYLQKHKGHPVQFESSTNHVEDYNVLKFSASDALNKRLRE